MRDCPRDCPRDWLHDWLRDWLRDWQRLERAADSKPGRIVTVTASLRFKVVYLLMKNGGQCLGGNPEKFGEGLLEQRGKQRAVEFERHGVVG
jgi:hypothetical protein